MTPADLAALVEKLRDNLAEAHRCIVVAQNEPGHSPTEDALIDAIRCVAAVAAELVDLCVELSDRLPASTAELSDLILERK